MYYSLNKSNIASLLTENSFQQMFMTFGKNPKVWSMAL
jgi:hypothetical protein